MYLPFPKRVTFHCVQSDDQRLLKQNDDHGPKRREYLVGVEIYTRVGLEGRSVVWVRERGHVSLLHVREGVSAGLDYGGLNRSHGNEEMARVVRMSQDPVGVEEGIVGNEGEGDRRMMVSRTD
jgi:hypothetical protein